jgi:hypothetical protein
MNIRQFSIPCSTVIAYAAFAFTLTTPATAQPYRSGPGNGTGTTAITPLSAVETETLQWMREEEKLARDVYDQLYNKWNLATFQTIAASEQTHFEAIGTLLTRYGVSDPAQGLAAGVYANPKLTALYSDLIAKGNMSVQDALEVGVLIEKTDIADLENALKTTTKADVKRVYTNLMNASYNHLEAFETGCQLLGGI